MKKKQIYEYLDFRAYLKDEVNALKGESQSLSFRDLAKKMGFPSHSHLDQIINKGKIIGEKTIQRICSSLDLNKNETEFFEILVYYGQEIDPVKKMLHYDSLLRTDGFIKFYPLQAKQYQYFSDWKLIALREIINLPDFEENASFVSQRLMIQGLTQSDLKSLVETLISIQLVVRDPSGKLKTTNNNISLPDGHNDQFIFAYHTSMIEKSKWALMNVDWKKRNISTISLAVDPKKINEINSYIESVRKEFVGKFSSHAEGALVYNFQIQLFPLCGESVSPLIVIDRKKAS